MLSLQRAEIPVWPQGSPECSQSPTGKILPLPGVQEELSAKAGLFTPWVQLLTCCWSAANVPSDLGIDCLFVNLADSSVDYDLRLPRWGRTVTALTSSLLLKVPSRFVWLLGCFVCSSVALGVGFFVISPVCYCISALLFDASPLCAVAHCKDRAGWAAWLFSLLSTCVCASVACELSLCLYISVYKLIYMCTYKLSLFLLCRAFLTAGSKYE